MKFYKSVMIIDDDPITQSLCRFVMQSISFAERVIQFQDTEEASGYIQQLINEQQPLPEIIFLDINMPLMNGWEFLQLMNKFPGKEQNQTSLYILTSSNSKDDIRRSQNYEWVKGFISKPLTKSILFQIQDEKSGGEFLIVESVLRKM